MKWCSCMCAISISSVTRPVKVLKGFQRITLAPGEAHTIEFEITPDQLSFLDEHLERASNRGCST